MEPLWSPVVATGGNQPQIARSRKRQKQAKSVATGCHRLREKFHGKEGVDGSSPSEGSTKAPQNGASSVSCTCTISSVRWVWSPLWSPQIENSVLKCAWPHAVGATNLPIRERAGRAEPDARAWTPASLLVPSHLDPDTRDAPPATRSKRITSIRNIELSFAKLVESRARRTGRRAHILWTSLTASSSRSRHRDCPARRKPIRLSCQAMGSRKHLCAARRHRPTNLADMLIF